MHRRLHHSWVSSVLFAFTLSVHARAVSAADIPRRLPPPGKDISSEAKAELLVSASRLQKLLDGKKSWKKDDVSDVAVLVKAVRYAVEHDEFWKEREVGHAREILALAELRIRQIENGKRPWRTRTGAVVRGYRSTLDGSIQPYGLVVPPSVSHKKPQALCVWLHGRADRKTDLQFLWERLHARYDGLSSKALVLHPFGRYCNAFKSAGEVDVLEAIEHVKTQYPIDPDRIAILGFSMGGAGAWHVGAHYAGRWVAVAPGAGFAETAQYNRLRKEQYP
ncbi:MAG: hypothetical protein AAF517_27705, partial [Planctomycetota bacterium]